MRGAKPTTKPDGSPEQLPPAIDLELSDQELKRYSRQLVLPDFGVEAQLTLKQARVVVVGAGALGAPVAGYLAAAGVGRIDIIDGDQVELSNLQRQLLHFQPDVGHSKAESVAGKLGLLNSEVLAQPFPARLEDKNAAALLTGHDVVVDCSDNFDTRYLVNATCVGEGLPLVEGGVVGLLGLVTTIIPGSSACYRCMFPEADRVNAGDNCEEAGILGAVAGTVGSIQALEAIKLVAGLGRPLTDRVLQIDGSDLTLTTVRAQRRPDCPVCA